MKLSFVVTTHGAMKTCSSSVEYAVMYASAWILVSAPIVVSFSTSEPRPTTTSSPIVDALAHARLVAEDHARADRRAGEHDRAGRDDRAVADLRRRQRLALRGRARRERRLLADDRVLEHLHALAEHRAGVDDRRWVDLSSRCRSSSERRAACRARARHAHRPSAPRAGRPCPPTSRRKCGTRAAAARRSRSCGLKMSPVRVATRRSVSDGSHGPFS